MPATDVKFGITLHAGTLIDSVEKDASIETKELPGSDGEVARVHVYKAMTKGSVKGHGTTAVVPGVGDSGVDGITGGVTVINNFKNTEGNEDFDGWEYSFTHYPSAQEVA